MYKIKIIALLWLFVAVIAISATDLGYTIKGKVIDKETSHPIVGVIVKLTNEGAITVTDSTGSFEFNNPIQNSEIIQFIHVAYKDNQVSVSQSDNKKELIVYLISKTVDVSPVLITSTHSHSKFDEFAEIENVLKSKELQRDLGLTLAATLKNETGMAIRSMGPAPARPVIRGMGSDRVLISEDGLKTSDLSASSPDHAVTIEPFSSERIEIIRGPKVLLKTATTIGGVVNIVRHDYPVEVYDGINGTLGLYGESANKGYLESIIVKVPYSSFAFRGELSKRKTLNLQTPNAELKNSYSDNFTGSFGLGFIKDSFSAGYAYRDYELDYGIPGGFIGAHPNGVDIKIYRVVHSGGIKSKLNTFLSDNIDFRYSNTYYRHQEFEKAGLIGAEFEITANNADLLFNHKHESAGTEGSLGISYEGRDFNIGGLVFMPKTKSNKISAYVWEQAEKGGFTFEGSARYNYDIITPAYEKATKIGLIRERVFNTYSISLSALTQVLPSIYTGINVSRSSRVPTIEELFTEGPHLAAYSYETGNPNLPDENGYGAEWFTYYKNDDNYFSLTFFRNDLHNYIIPKNTGKINYQTFLPIYATDAVSALFYGVESHSEIKLSEQLQFNSSISYTLGENTETNNPLAQIPPLKGVFELRYSNQAFSCGISAELTTAQERVDEFESPTAGYAVYKADFEYVYIGKNLIHSITLNIDNILNTEYRNHLSRIKSILPEPGRSFRLVYKLLFDLH